MLIDWFTVCAQILNFIILVWLLKRFLYRPIMEAIDARELLIAAELTAAAAKMAEAQRERDELAHRNEEIAGQRTALLDQARVEAEALHQRLVGEARVAAEAQDVKLRQALVSDIAQLKDSIISRTGTEVVTIMRRALGDLASTSLEERVVEVLLRRVRELDATTRKDFAQALGTSHGPVLVRSAFTLTPDQRASISSTLDAGLFGKIPLSFEIKPEIICGIELVAGGRKIAWSLADYLASMERMIAGVMVARAEAARPGLPAPSTNSAPAPAQAS